MLFVTDADQTLLAEAESSLAEVPSHQQPAARVLAVDDESSACKLLSLILGPPAFHCTTACSGEEALVTLQRERFDAVISDLKMPG
ncbi:MAG TPA: response regulator, partial [Candidatus Sulfotelmatobacter sp.]|nr:response regulator [Candidatus Sulfotelmatobacter sp.]